MKISPYEKENLVFIDTEFSSLEPDEGELLSIGMIKLSGEELYIELKHEGECSDWVTHNILPILEGQKVHAGDAVAQMQDFLGDTHPFAVAFVDNYDVIYLTKLFGAGNLPFRWVSVDFASVLFAMGINPVKFLAGEKGAVSFYKELGIDMKKYRQHHALDDAKLLRDVWQKLFPLVSPLPLEP